MGESKSSAQKPNKDFTTPFQLQPTTSFELESRPHQQASQWALHESPLKSLTIFCPFLPGQFWHRGLSITLVPPKRPIGILTSLTNKAGKQPLLWGVRYVIAPPPVVIAPHWLMPAWESTSTADGQSGKVISSSTKSQPSHCPSPANTAICINKHDATNKEVDRQVQTKLMSHLSV